MCRRVVAVVDGLLAGRLARLPPQAETGATNPSCADWRNVAPSSLTDQGRVLGLLAAIGPTALLGADA
jgi:hypothetical protein